MPISEYILLTLLAAGGVALPDGAVAAATLGADAIVQPNGGALSSPPPRQDKKDDTHLKVFSKTKVRHHRSGKVSHRKVRQPHTPKKEG
jgi:hypothetical protein